MLHSFPRIVENVPVISLNRENLRFLTKREKITAHLTNELAMCTSQLACPSKYDIIPDATAHFENGLLLGCDIKPRSVEGSKDK
jgi:hypothetical protein